MSIEINKIYVDDTKWSFQTYTHHITVICFFVWVWFSRIGRLLLIETFLNYFPIKFCFQLYSQRCWESLLLQKQFLPIQLSLHFFLQTFIEYLKSIVFTHSRALIYIQTHIRSFGVNVDKINKNEWRAKK